MSARNDWLHRGRIVLSIAVLAGLAWLVGAVAVGEAGSLEASRLAGAAALGLLLLGAWLSGLLARSFNLPSVAGFLVFGMAAGPGALRLITEAQLDILTLANELAISIVALTAGGEIRWRFLRGQARLIVFTTLAQTLIIGAGAAALAVFLLPAFDVLPEGLPTMETLRAALLVGVIAVASSPSVVVAVTTELRARGVFAQRAISVAICKDLALIVLFAIAISVASAPALGTGAEDPPTETATQAQVEQDADASQAQAPEAERPSEPAPQPASTSQDAQHDGHGVGGDMAPGGMIGAVSWRIFGSLLAGVVIGFVLAWYMHTLRANLSVFVVLAGFGIAIGAEAIGLEPLIVALVAGMLMENVFGEISQALFEAIEDLSLPVYCVFFATAGARVAPATLLASAPPALTFVAIRSGLIWLATWVGARSARVPSGEARDLWTAFLPQAAVTLALLTIIRETLGRRFDVASLDAMILSVIAIHAIAGAVLFRIAVVRAEAREKEQQSPADGDAADQRPLATGHEPQ